MPNYIPRQSTLPLKTKTSLFEDAYLSRTDKKRGSRVHRIFKQRTVVHIDVINSIEVRLRYIETIAALRCNGFGSECLSFLCDLADQYGVQISLKVMPFGYRSLDAVQLTLWYQRFGFERLGFENEMVRYPNERTTT